MTDSASSSEISQVKADSSHEWEDCLPLIREGCATLKIGELLHTKTFNLRDAMQAMEIGDPKTDSGLFPPHSAYLLDEGFKYGRIPKPGTLSLDDRVLLYDSLIAFCVEWLDGRMAPTQAFFTCAYLHDISLWEDDDSEGGHKLRIFCQLFLQLCHELLGQISRARVFDAEDFIPHLCGLTLEQPEGTLPLLRQTAAKFPFLTQLVSKMDPNNPTKSHDYRFLLTFPLLEDADQQEK